MTTRISRKFWIMFVAILAAGLPLSGCGGNRGGAYRGGATPQDVFQTWQGAVKAHDHGLIFDCLTEEGQDALAGYAILNLNSIADLQDAALKTQAQDLARKYHVDGSFTREKRFAGGGAVFSGLGARVENKREFVIEVGQWSDKLPAGRMIAVDPAGPPKPVGALSADLAAGTLSDVQITGDLAVGKVALPQGNQTITFEKVNGAWLLSDPPNKM